MRLSETKYNPSIKLMEIGVSGEWREIRGEYDFNDARATLLRQFGDIEVSASGDRLYCTDPAFLARKEKFNRLCQEYGY